MTRTLCVVVAVLGLTSLVALGQTKTRSESPHGYVEVDVEKSKVHAGARTKERHLDIQAHPRGDQFDD